MKFSKIHIIGGPGSGKSYLAKKLERELHCPMLDLDNIFWDNNSEFYGTKMDPDARDMKLNKFMENSNYVIEGVYYKWLIPSFEVADIIVILNPNVILRTFRIVKRFILRKLGLEKGKNEKLKNLTNLIKWNLGYESTSLLPARELLRDNNKVIIFSSADKAYKYLLESQGHSTKG